MQLSNNPLSPVTAATLRVNGRNLHIQCRVSKAARTGRSASPLAVSGARDLQQSAHSGNCKLVAVCIHPGVLHRDPLAKYAAAFFNTSTSSFVSANSRRSRAFSASNSVGARLAGVPARSPACSFPARLRRIQFHTLESGISSRFAAWLPPIDSASRTASILYSSVYRRFGTSSFLPICSSVHQKNTKILMYVKPGQGHIETSSIPSNFDMPTNVERWIFWLESSDGPHCRAVRLEPVQSQYSMPISSTDIK